MLCLHLEVLNSWFNFSKLFRIFFWKILEFNGWPDWPVWPGWPEWFRSRFLQCRLPKCERSWEVGTVSVHLSICLCPRSFSTSFFNLKRHTSRVWVFHTKKPAKTGVCSNLWLDVWTGGIRTCVPGASAWQNGLLWSGVVWWINPGETSRRNFTTAAHRRKGRVGALDQQGFGWLGEGTIVHIVCVV